MKIHDVFFKNSNLLSSMNDCSGLWLFAVFAGDSFVEAVRIGFKLGFYEGIDYGVESISGDPNKVTIRIEILTKEGIHTYIDQGFERKDFRHAINKISMNICDNLIIEQTDDNRLNWKVEDKSGKVRVELELKLDVFHLYPSIVMRNNFVNMALCPKVRVKGEVSVGGEKYKVKGFGAMDQYWSKKIESESAMKFGYSHYEPIMWNEEFTSVLYYVVTSEGNVYLQDMLLADKENGLIRLDKVSIDHINYKESNGSFCPTHYSVRAAGKDCDMEYEVNIVLRDKVRTWGFPDRLLKAWAPDMSLPLIDAEGVIREKIGGSMKKTAVRGKGILEFGLAYNNPFKQGS